MIKLSKYINSVNSITENWPAGTLTGLLQANTVRFAKFAFDPVQVPAVNELGEPAGFNRWINLTLKYDVRTTTSLSVYDVSGNLPPAGFPGTVTWNHVLAYPGTSSWLNGQLTGSTAGLGWYRAKYSRNALGVDSDAYPGNRDAVPGSTSIWDPINLNF